MSYAALWCKSNYSFLEGASHPEELVERAHQLGLAAVAVTDRDGVYGVVRAHEKARELGVQLILGAQITVDDGSQVVLLVENRAGYANLCQLISAGRLRSEKGASVVAWREVCAHAGGLVALWRGGECAELRDAFGDRLYALAARHRRAEELDDEARLRQSGLPVVAGNEVLYHTPARRRLQDVLTCIRHGVNLYGAGRLLKPNAEHDLKSAFAFNTLYADDSAAVARTLEIAARCRFSLAELRYRYPSERLPDGKSSAEWLRELSFAGARRRYHDLIPDDVARQLDKELALIEELDYCGYFLTMYEVIEFCRAANIMCQGRGSAANSAVCFCLGITAVDPKRINLLFERFLSRERAEPPDIDLDIEHERREEVIQHVYQKYGRDRAAMVANVIRYRARSAIRDVGKALGLSETSLDRVARLLSHHDTLGSSLTEADLDFSTGANAQLVELANEILNFPRHLSIHPGGFLLGHEPVSTLVPIENGTMEARTVIQWDKDDVESVGLFKVDLLGLGALTHLHRCFDLIERHRGVRLSMATLPEGDEATYDAICRADTVGVFQIESRAQMSMLPRLKPRTYYDLVIEVSIVRPGPITGGMVHPYLRRRNGEEAVEYPHPDLIPVLEKTKGVPLFQEQVMQLAVVAADYTPGEADQLRRDMAAWRRNGRMEQHRERLISRMLKKGIAPEFAERVYKQICGFGEYGFPESHAASFALISYAGSYLKWHYPAEFTCSLLNAQPMGFYTPSTIVEDAKRHGVEVRPIDITRSEWDCTIESGAVRMGLRYVKGLGDGDWRHIAAASPFASLDDFTQRAGLSHKALAALAEAGAFDALGSARRPALWQVRGAAPTPIALVDTEPAVALPALTPAEIIDWDYRRTRHSTHGHPLASLRDELRAQNLPDARTVATLRHGQPVDYAGLVICRQHPGTASGVTFMTLEDETGFVNLVVWQSVFEEFSVLAKTQPLLGVSGRLQVQDGVVHVVAEKLWQPAIRFLSEHGASRDFH
jgi:error-prone DNA polymerase